VGNNWPIPCLKGVSATPEWTRPSRNSGPSASTCSAVLLATSLAVTAPCRADQAPPPQVTAAPRGLISSISITRALDAGIDEKVMIQNLQKLLFSYGFQSDHCEEVSKELKLLTETRGFTRSSQDATGSLQKREAEVVHTSCAKVDPSLAVYRADLTLDVDRELGNQRRAVLQLIPIGGPAKMFSGGYGQKPHLPSPEEWYVIIDRAIRRTLLNENEDTSISLDPPTLVTVGETTHLDASQSWDLDGDAFELDWHVSTESCEGGGRLIPYDTGCPAGMKKARHVVVTRADTSNLTRSFEVPMVGDYEVLVQAKVGTKESAGLSRMVRARPRRPNSIISRQTYLAMPKGFIQSGREREPALMLRTGYLRRVLARVGTLGSFEEVHIGGSMAVFDERKDLFKLDGHNGTMFDLEIAVRMMLNDGRIGITTEYVLGGGFVGALRGDLLRIEPMWMGQFMAGLYFSFGYNYTASAAKYCNTVCFDVTVGPALTGIRNGTTEKTALLGGGEIGLAVTF
jgi:hypothetical protein